MAEELASSGKTLTESIDPSSSMLSSISQSVDSKWGRTLLIGGSLTGVSIAAVIVANKYLSRRPVKVVRKEQNGSTPRHTKPNGKLPFNAANNNATRETSVDRMDSSTFLRSESQDRTIVDTTIDETLTPRSSVSTVVVAPTTSGRCPNCCGKRLSWSSELTHSGSHQRISKTASAQQLLIAGLGSVKSASRFWEESLNRLKGGSLSGGDGALVNLAGKDETLDDILARMKSIIDDVESLRNEMVTYHVSDNAEEEDDEFDTASVVSMTSTTTTATMPFFDVEPNLHFFKVYQQALDALDVIQAPRVDRTLQVLCETESEFRAKVHCLRLAFNMILENEAHREYYADMGREILEILLKHSLRDPSDCIACYDEFLEYVSDASNHESIETEIAVRKIYCLSFYDLVLDYIILESFDDLESPPSAVTSVAKNSWLSAGFREMAIQTAVSAVLRHKRSKLIQPNGFFAHFYAILDHISPILAWGFLGSDLDLKLKCDLVRESLLEVVRDYFCFDRVRYTNLNDLSEDILRVTKERYWELNNKLSICD